MEWKSVRTGKPKPNKIYVVVDVKGSFCLREYKDVLIYERNPKSAKRWRLAEQADETAIERKTMFVPVGNTFGIVPKKNVYMYFCEVPDAPDGLQEAHEIREKIKMLEKELERLGGNT